MNSGGLPADYLARFREALDERNVPVGLGEAGIAFKPGLTDAECAAIEQRYQFRFPPDLRSLLQFALPVGAEFPDWRDAPEAQIHNALDWPADGICFDIEHNEFWLPAWGPRPPDLTEAYAIASRAVAAAPCLIPVYSHRYTPDQPARAGNPIFSVYQTDVIYYGLDLADYFTHEFKFPRPAWAATSARPIFLWDGLIDKPVEWVGL